MDWKLFIGTFTTIFIAEMGDKTQLAALAASASSKSTWTVLMAVVLALSLAGALGVLAGQYIGDWLSPQVLRYGAGGLFLLFGFWIIFRP